MSNSLRSITIAALLSALSVTAFANEAMTKEQAIEKALAAHPGEVIKAYQETKRGVKAWEVQINGEDGKTWEVFYAVADGAFVTEEGEAD